MNSTHLSATARARNGNGGLCPDRATPPALTAMQEAKRALIDTLRGQVVALCPCTPEHIRERAFDTYHAAYTQLAPHADDDTARIAAYLVRLAVLETWLASADPRTEAERAADADYADLHDTQESAR